VSRSAPARVQVELIPAELREWHQWVCWRWEKRKDKNGNDTWTKPPMQPNGEYANSTNPETWTSFDNALAALQAGRGLAGIGFVFADDPYSGIDIDDCRNSQNGIIQPWARLIIERLNSYTEISPSGTGVKTWIRAKLSAGGRHRNRRAYEGGEIEIYSRGRYFTVTSQHLTGTPNTIESRQRELDQLHEELFPVSVPPGNGRPHPNGSRPDSLSDRELIDKAKGAANGAKFTSLWNGVITGYPSQSEADHCARCWRSGRTTIPQESMRSFARAVYSGKTLNGTSERITASGPSPQRSRERMKRTNQEKGQTEMARDPPY